MRHLDVDFVQHRPRWPWICHALALACLAGALPQGLEARRIAQQADAMEAISARLQADIDAINRSAATRAEEESKPMPYDRDARTVQDLAGFDAPRVLAALESVRVIGVRVTAIELTATDHGARAELAVSDPNALLQYLSDLNAGLSGPQGWRLVRTQSATGTAGGTATIVAGALVVER